MKSIQINVQNAAIVLLKKRQENYPTTALPADTRAIHSLLSALSAEQEQHNQKMASRIFTNLSLLFAIITNPCISIFILSVISEAAPTAFASSILP